MAKGFGWRPDYPDFRDVRFSGFRVPVYQLDLPPITDWRHECPPVYDQGELGSCTANAIGGMYEFISMQQGAAPVTPSRLFIYYLERQIEGTIDYDNGAMIRTGMKVVQKYGASPEVYWPYDISKFRDRPADRAFTKALRHQVITYESVPRDLQVMKQLLFHRLPFVFGFTVFNSFYDLVDGVVPLPKQSDRMVGGHAVMAVGYNDEKSCFIVRNSWGSDWGLDGYFYLPYTFLADRRLSQDFWTIRVTEG